MPTKCMDFLKRKKAPAIVPVYVVFGDDEFLRRETLRTIRKQVVGPEPDDFTYSEHDGETAKFADVVDELFTPPFLGDQRLVLVEDADDFITKHRDSLLPYVQKPSATGVLVMDVRTWRSNTKLATAVEGTGTAIECTTPKAWHTPAWCVQWAADHHDKQLSSSAAEWLVELVGPILGLLDQELGKLASFVGTKPNIDEDDVTRMVAGTRTESAFKLLDLVLDGETAKALEMLHRQLTAGEAPVGLLAMTMSQLRKLTKAARLYLAGKSMNEALGDAGVPPFAIQKSQAHLKRLGRPRMAAMYRRLLEADLAIKGGSGLTPRLALERFILDIAVPAN